MLVSVLTVKNGWRQSASEQDPIPWYVVSEISMRCCYGTVTAWEVTAGVSAPWQLNSEWERGTIYSYDIPCRACPQQPPLNQDPL